MDPSTLLPKSILTSAPYTATQALLQESLKSFLSRPNQSSPPPTLQTALPLNTPGYAPKYQTNCFIPTFSPSHSSHENAAGKDVTYVINCCPWLVREAYERTGRVMSRENSSTSTGSDITTFTSVQISGLSSSLRRESDGALNKYDHGSGMPPFLMDKEVGFVAERMIRASWIARTRGVEEGRENTSLTLGGIESTSHEIAVKLAMAPNEILKREGCPAFFPPVGGGVGKIDNRERTMRIHMLAQAIGYERMRRAIEHGYLRDRWEVERNKIRDTKERLRKGYEGRMRSGGCGGEEREQLMKLREAQLKAGGDYEKSVKTHTVKVMASRPSVGWGKREELEGQMVKNMEGQWKVFEQQFEEMGKRYDDIRRKEGREVGIGKGETVKVEILGLGYEETPSKGLSKEELAEELKRSMSEYWSRQEKQIDDMEIGTEQEFKNHNDLPLARIKRIMKSDEDVRMISAEAPVLFAKACEMFILELTLSSWCQSQAQKRRTVQKEDIRDAIKGEPTLDFLVDVIEPREDEEMEEEEEEGIWGGQMVGMEQMHGMQSGGHGGPMVKEEAMGVEEEEGMGGLGGLRTVFEAEPEERADGKGGGREASFMAKPGGRL